MSVENGVLDNGVIRVTIDERGLITSLYDVEAQREVIAPGAAGNLLQLHVDTPNHWDAWDVDSFYKNNVRDVTEVDSVDFSTVEGVATVVVTRSFGRSSVTQTLRLRPGAKRVDIETTIDWHEAEKFLKAAYPVDVHADRSASETQFGHIFRPTHQNTSWDAAKFEIAAHRWVHVGEPGYGVAVVNDSTYGHDINRTAREDGGDDDHDPDLADPGAAVPRPEDRPGRAHREPRAGGRRRDPGGDRGGLPDQPARAGRHRRRGRRAARCR